jgi:hypothetical protein
MYPLKMHKEVNASTLLALKTNSSYSCEVFLRQSHSFLYKSMLPHSPNINQQTHQLLCNNHSLFTGISAHSLPHNPAMAVPFSYHVTVWIREYAGLNVQLSNITNFSDFDRHFSSMLDNILIEMLAINYKQKNTIIYSNIFANFFITDK